MSLRILMWSKNKYFNLVDLAPKASQSCHCHPRMFLTCSLEGGEESSKLLPLLTLAGVREEVSPEEVQY